MRSAFAALLALLSPLSAAGLTVTLDPAGYKSFATMTSHSYSAIEYGYLDLGILALPQFPLSSIRVDGGFGSINTTSYRFERFEPAEFGVSFDHDTTANLSAWAWSYGRLYFSVDESVQYVLSGDYSMANAPGFQLHQEAHLTDVTTGSNRFYGVQDSTLTPNESFSLGLQEGDTENQRLGSLVGTLAPGHVYSLAWDYHLYSFGSTGSGSALGDLHLKFVPEPTSGPLLILGLTGLALYGRQRAPSE